MAPSLATASLQARLTANPGRAVVSARGHHFIVDSPAALGGPNEEVNPIDLLLSALATCGTFVCETAAREMGIALAGITVAVAGDFDPRGICGQPVAPSLQAFRVQLRLAGPDPVEAEQLVAAFRSRCPVYGTLVKAAPIAIEVILENPSIQRKEPSMKRLECRDAGFNCDKVIEAESEDEIMHQAGQHIVEVHHMTVTPELAEQVRGLIRTVPGEPAKSQSR